VSSNASLSYDIPQFGSSLCAWNARENGSCSKEIAADLAIRISDGPEDVYDIVSIPLCRAHSHNELFLNWLTRLAHRIALKTVTALRDHSLADIRFTYRLVERDPRVVAPAGESPEDRCQGCDAPGIESSGETRVAFARTSWRERPFIRTFAVPRRPGVRPQTKTPRVVARAKKAWYDLTQDERIFYNEIASTKGIPGIFLFVNRYMMAVRKGRKSLDMVSFTDLLA